MKCAEYTQDWIYSILKNEQCAVLEHDTGQTPITKAAALLRKEEVGTTGVSRTSANKGHYNKFQIICTNNGKQ